VDNPRVLAVIRVGSNVNTSGDDTDRLLGLARNGDAAAVARLFDRYRDRLKRMVRLRMDRRLQGRLDPSDVLQDAYLDLTRRVAEYAADPAIPFFLWLRLLTGQRLLMLHRRHLGAKMRAAGQELSLNHAVPFASSVSLAEQLVGGLTSPTEAVVRAEMQARLQEALDELEPLDREVLVLRHFEELSNNETAAVLGIQKTAASNRYVRALKRLKDVLSAKPGFTDS
jgi:RNA polymerase sigma-70 factor, ECF subfamily